VHAVSFSVAYTPHAAVQVLVVGARDAVAHIHDHAQVPSYSKVFDDQ